MLDDLAKLNQLKLEETGDPEIATRIAQYELAYRMQTAVPELTDLSKEPEEVFKLYGPESKKPGTFAANCLLARRLAERGVRFIQLYHRDWDHHGGIKEHIAGTAKEVDQACAALVTDLKNRGMLQDTLIVWTGEFGRTPMNEERNGSKLLGRDHHPHCFSIWLAGGGIKAGTVLGETDDLGYFVARDKVSVHDLLATILHLLGFDAHRLSYPYQGLDQRLIGPTNAARVIGPLLA